MWNDILITNTAYTTFLCIGAAEDLKQLYLSIVDTAKLCTSPSFASEFELLTALPNNIWLLNNHLLDLQFPIDFHLSHGAGMGGSKRFLPKGKLTQLR